MQVGTRIRVESENFVITTIRGDVIHATRVSEPRNLLTLQVQNGEISVPGVPDAAIEILTALTGNPNIDTLILAKVDDSVVLTISELDAALNNLAQQNSYYLTKLEVSFPDKILTYRPRNMSVETFYKRIKSIFNRLRLFGASTALLLAVFNNDAIRTRIALDAGADVNIGDTNSGSSGLQSASGRGYLEIVKLLLENHADVNHPDFEGNTALSSAALYGRTEIVKILLQADADVNHGDHHRNTALMSAAENDHVDVVQELLRYHANIDAPNFEGRTALMVASEKGHVDVVRELLQSGANVNYREYDGATALILAMMAEETDVAQVLRQYGAQ